MTDDEKRLINRKKIKEIILKNLPKGRYININYRAKLLSVKDSVLINKIIIKNKIKIDGKNEIFKLKDREKHFINNIAVLPEDFEKFIHHLNLIIGLKHTSKTEILKKLRIRTVFYTNAGMLTQLDVRFADDINSKLGTDVFDVNTVLKKAVEEAEKYAEETYGPSLTSNEEPLNDSQHIDEMLDDPVDESVSSSHHQTPTSPLNALTRPTILEDHPDNESLFEGFDDLTSNLGEQSYFDFDESIFDGQNT